MKINTKIFAVFFVVTSLCTQDSNLGQNQSQNVYQEIREVVLKNCQKDRELTFQERQIIAMTEMMNIFKGKFTPVAKQLDQYTTFSLFFNLLDHKDFISKNSSSSIVFDAKKVSDFGLVSDTPQDYSVLFAVNKNINTTVGKIFTSQFLLAPTSDVNTLKIRANIIKTLVEQDALRDQIFAATQEIKRTQNSYLNFFVQRSEMQKAIIDGQFISGGILDKAIKSYLPFVDLGAWDRNVACKQFGQVIGVVTLPMVPLSVYKMCCKLLPWKLKSPVVGGLVSAGFIFLAYKGFKSEQRLLNYMHGQMNDVTSMIRAMHAIDKIIQKTPELKNRLEYADDLHALFDTKNEKVSKSMRKLLRILSTNTFKSEPTFLSLRGRVLAAYAIMEDVKAEFARALHAVGEVDMYCGLAQLIKDQQNTDLPYCFVEYVEDAKTPVILLEDMWNPLINVATTSAHTIVKNSISLGVNDGVRNVIITGPNAGGKSTFMKGVGINVVLAQTLGIASAKSFIMTPFHNINSYMNIADNVQKGDSRFMAEVKAAHALFTGITELDKNKFSFSIVDELFSGTTSQEGSDATYSLAKRMGTCQNSVLLLATHFPKLKELAANTTNFKNCQVRVIKNADGTITYPFKLQDGFADQNVAFDILKQQGFDTSIFDDADVAHVGA